MSQVIQVEIDLAEYEDDIRDYLNGGLKKNWQNMLQNYTKSFIFIPQKATERQKILITI